MKKDTALKTLSIATHAQLGHSVDEVVRISGLGRTLVFSEIKEGRLVARKCGRRTIVLRSDIERWLSHLDVAHGKLVAEGSK